MLKKFFLQLRGFQLPVRHGASLTVIFYETQTCAVTSTTATTCRLAPPAGWRLTCFAQLRLLPPCRRQFSVQHDSSGIRRTSKVLPPFQPTTRFFSSTPLQPSLPLYQHSILCCYSFVAKDGQLFRERVQLRAAHETV